MKVIATLLLFLCGYDAAAQPLVFTAIPDTDETRLKARFNKVADYLSKELNIEVNYIPVKSYAAAVTAFRNNQVQLAWFGGLSGVQARKLSPDAEAIAQGVEDRQFKSYFIAHSSTGLSKAETLPTSINGMSFSFGSKSSTSGRLMPEHFIRQQFKRKPEQLFSRVGFSGNHSRTIALVQSGSYQLGAVNYQVWEQELAAGKIDLNKVKIIWTTPEYTDYHWTVRGDIDKIGGEGFKQKLTQVLLNIQQPTLLAAFPRSGFIAASNNDYQNIADIARDIGLLK